MKKIKEETVAGDIASAPSVIGKPAKRKKEEEEEIIDESAAEDISAGGGGFRKAEDKISRHPIGQSGIEGTTSIDGKNLHSHKVPLDINCIIESGQGKKAILKTLPHLGEDGKVHSHEIELSIFEINNIIYKKGVECFTSTDNNHSHTVYF